MKILIVDDELVSREKLMLHLKNYGDCQAVENGRDAIAAYSAALESGDPFDLVALDVSMPDINGLEVLRRIRHIEQKSNISPAKTARIMMVTSEADRSIVILCVKNGCDDYIIKPFNQELVSQKVERLLAAR